MQQQRKLMYIEQNYDQLHNFYLYFETDEIYIMTWIKLNTAEFSHIDGFFATSPKYGEMTNNSKLGDQNITY